MVEIGGNITATIQMKTSGGKNSIGENVESWNPVGSVLGFLDYASGQNSIQQYNAKLQDTTHYFFCDRSRWTFTGCTSENCRMVINGDIYNVLLIDNPMQMDEHLEIYLEYIGGGLGV